MKNTKPLVKLLIPIDKVLVRFSIGVQVVDLMRIGNKGKQLASKIRNIGKVSHNRLFIGNGGLNQGNLGKAPRKR